MCPVEIHGDANNARIICSHFMPNSIEFNLPDHRVHARYRLVYAWDVKEGQASWEVESRSNNTA